MKNSEVRKEICLLSYIGDGIDIRPEWIQLNACEPMSLIEAGWLSQVSGQKMRWLENHLQVSIMHAGWIFNLDPDKPTQVDEIERMDQLSDP